MPTKLSDGVKKRGLERHVLELEVDGLTVCPRRFTAWAWIASTRWWSGCSPRAGRCCGSRVSRTVHWAFDLGMVWFDNDLRLGVTGEVLRDPRNAWLANLRGRPLAVPADPRLQPQGEALRWHAAQVAGGRQG